MGKIEETILVFFQRFLVGPMTETRRAIEVPNHMSRQFFDVLEQPGGIEFPRALDADVLEEVRKLRIVVGPHKVGPLLRMVDRQEMDRADDSVRSHRVDDVLRVRSRARVVIDLGTDRKAHTTSQAFADHGGVSYVNTGSLRCSVEIARVGELQCAPHGVHGARVFERQIVDVIRDHEKARRISPAGMVEPQKEHAGRICDRPFLGKGTMLALRMTVDVGDRRYTRVAQRSTSFTPRGIQADGFVPTRGFEDSGVRPSTHGTSVSAMISIPFFITSNDIDGFESLPAAMACAGRYGRCTRPTMAGGTAFSVSANIS
jgi:hypothetical protein